MVSFWFLGLSILSHHLLLHSLSRELSGCRAGFLEPFTLSFKASRWRRQTACSSFHRMRNVFLRQLLNFFFDLGVFAAFSVRNSKQWHRWWTSKPQLWRGPWPAPWPLWKLWAVALIWLFGSGLLSFLSTLQVDDLYALSDSFWWLRSSRSTAELVSHVLPVWMLRAEQTPRFKTLGAQIIVRTLQTFEAIFWFNAVLAAAITGHWESTWDMCNWVAWYNIEGMCSRVETVAFVVAGLAQVKVPTYGALEALAIKWVLLTWAQRFKTCVACLAYRIETSTRTESQSKIKHGTSWWRLFWSPRDIHHKRH